ncbi:MAG TPA: peptidylprolyl isomerase [Pyrinomonadaceae bacterium]|jgi:cyclophilin family peptidyl-prolyl cis-trans isomerase/HEAT repeat protein
MPNTPRVSEKGRARAQAALLTLCALLTPAPRAGAAPRAPAQKPPPAKAKPAAEKEKAAPNARAGARVPQETLLRIMAAEDERRWEEADLGALLKDASAAVRARAALAAGRIGDEGAVAPLGALLNADRVEAVRSAAAFALGEIEAESGAAALLETLRLSKSPEVRARAVEALGKIAAALPEARADAKKRIGDGLTGTLAAEHRLSKPNRALVLLGLTALLRARPEGGARTAALFLSSTDARVRADAANALARTRAKESLERVRAMLATDADAVARANAARVLGAAEDAGGFDVLVAHAATDADARVRVSAVRALAQLKDARAADPLVRRGGELFAAYKSARVGGAASPPEVNELLEVATALGRVLQNSNDERAVTLLRAVRDAGVAAPEVETALARIAPSQYLRDRGVTDLVSRVSRQGDPAVTWQKVSAVAQGLGEMAGVTSAQAGNSVVSLQADAQIALRTLVQSRHTPPSALPDLLRSLAAFKPADLAAVARAALAADDVIARAAAAGILSELPPDAESERALLAALPRALRDETDDAALSVLGALAKQTGAEATSAIRSALETPDYLVRRRAADILRERPGGAAAGGRRVETVNTRNHREDYERAAARAGKAVRAVVTTDKGAVTIELLPEEAPLTVDNFVQLARRNYFNGVPFHRVVPNFVVQGGDPRGDGNGGPGYQIRCEINTVPYARGAVGMALSGKDTGGSQWFITHSPQPHLDGGYTVFGRVVEGMDVVDRIVRGDRIRSVTVTERGR